MGVGAASAAYPAFGNGVRVGEAVMYILVNILLPRAEQDC